MGGPFQIKIFNHGRPVGTDRTVYRFELVRSTYLTFMKKGIIFNFVFFKFHNRILKLWKNKYGQVENSRFFRVTFLGQVGSFCGFYPGYH